MKSKRIVALIVGAFALVAGSAPAATTATLDSVIAIVDGGLLHAEAKATFVTTSEPPVVVATDPAGDAVDPDLAPVAAAAGIDVTELALRTTAGQKLEFIISLAEMNVPPPHEIVRYLWQFKANGNEYWVQAKMSDVASGTTFADDPVGAVTHVSGAFRLRGDCQVVGVISTCRHLAWLAGEFDVAAKQVRMRVPLHDMRWPDITHGATIEPDEAMTASIQVGVSNASTSDSVAVVESYAVPGRGSVSMGLAVAAPDADPTTLTYGDLPGPATSECSFESGFPHDHDSASATCTTSKTVDITSYAPGSYALFAVACADTCVYGSAPFEI